MKILLVRGPGAHFNLIYEFLFENNYEFEYIEFSPKYCLKSIKNKKIISTEYSRLFNFFDKSISFIYTKLFNSKKTYNRILYKGFSIYISFRNYKCDVLISCAQVSNFLFRKYKGRKKLILEYPMIHPHSHKKITEDYILQKQINAKDYLNKSDVKTLLQEINYADEINLVSNFAINSFIKHNVSEKKLNLIQLYSNEYFKLDNNITKCNKFTILFVGRIELQKGIYTLLSTINQISFEYNCIMIGAINDDSLNLELQKNKNIKYIPSADKTDLQKYYSMSHVLILPSVQESFGLVLLESLQCGTPVIASSNTGISDILTDCNGLSYKNDYELLEKINLLHDNYDKFSDSTSNRNSITQKFNKLNFQKNYKRILDEL